MQTLVIVGATVDQVRALPKQNQNNFLEKVLNEICISSVNEDGIVSIIDQGTTHPEIIKATNGYGKFIQLKDVSAEYLMQTIYESGYNDQLLSICGLYSDNVKSLTLDLSKKYQPNINLLTFAIEDTAKFNFKWAKRVRYLQLIEEDEVGFENPFNEMWGY